MILRSCYFREAQDEDETQPEDSKRLGSIGVADCYDLQR